MNRTLNRRAALAVIGSAGLAPLLGAASPAISVGSKDFTEEFILGEMYAQLLERHGFAVTRKLGLGGTQVAMAALLRGDIDLYPEYTGTALINMLKLPVPKTAAQTYELVRSGYARKYDLTWLRPAPMNDTQALATTQAIAAKYHLRTLSDLAKAAPNLRLGAIPEFTKRADGLPGLQKAYGGFDFNEVRLFDIALKYKALESGDVDVVVAFGTDGQIAADRLVVFVDDKHFWPTYQVAPVVRDATLRAHPQIRAILDALAPSLTDDAMRALNERVDGDHRDPAAVAGDFLKARRLS